MENAIEAIHAALAADAPPEARAAGAQACRAILATLEPTPSAPQLASVLAAMRGVPPEQLLDLAIAKLRTALPTGVEVAPVKGLNFHLVPLPRS